MSISETYLGAARKFALVDRSDLQELAIQLRAWVEHQADSVRGLGPTAGLRCLVYVTLARGDGERISCELVSGRNRRHCLTIAATGRNHLVGLEPQTMELNGAITLVALLAAELGVAVTLQP